MPVKVTCDGPARVQVIFDFYAMTPQSRDLSHMFGHSIPDICRSHDVEVPAAGSIVLRAELMPYAARIARRYRRTKLIVHFLTLREDGYFWSEGSSGRHTYLAPSGSSR
jgi:hypothetical protein